MDAFTLETAEEVFCNSVVVGVALAGHALAEAKIREVLAESTSSILDAAVRVEDEAFGRAVASDSHVKCGEGKVCVNAVRESVANDLFGAEVLDHGEVEPALIGGDIGNIADPGHTRQCEGEMACQEIRGNGMRMI